MVFANVRKVVRIVLPFDHFHTGPWCKAFACFASIMAFNLCPCGEGTGCSDRMSRRKTPMIVTASRSGLTELGPESGQREEASLSLTLSHCVILAPTHSHGGITAQMGFYCDPK